jgi:hypothetical protein
MSRIEQYRTTLRTLEDWESFLLKESGLPGPRGNLELAQAVADEGTTELFHRFIGFGPDKAPTNSPYEFLAVCGVVGLGRLLAEGRTEVLTTLRQCANDPRWRTREGVAMGLQRFGEKNMDALVDEMEGWCAGSLLEQRAVAAALCEPKLLGQPRQARRVLRVLDKITTAIGKVEDRKSDDFKALRKGMGYCWSVAVAACPEQGKRAMERWCKSDDPDVLWIMKENLKKDRLARMDKDWVEQQKRRLAAG